MKPLDRILLAKLKFQASPSERAVAIKEAQAALEDYFDMPEPEGAYGGILRLSQFCKVMDTWAEVRSTPTESPIYSDSDFRDAWHTVRMAISKSNLLARMFFAGEEPRKRPCPEHKGSWSGCVWTDLKCGCMWNSNVTGWLKDEEIIPTEPHQSE
jgi:hypothetical protein